MWVKSRGHCGDYVVVNQPFRTLHHYRCLCIVGKWAGRRWRCWLIYGQRNIACFCGERLFSRERSLMFKPFHLSRGKNWQKKKKILTSRQVYTVNKQVIQIDILLPHMMGSLLNSLIGVLPKKIPMVMPWQLKRLRVQVLRSLIRS